MESGIGEPLRLVIEVGSVPTAEAEDIDVSLASRSDFSQAGVEYPSLAARMDFALVPSDQGNYQVVITTETEVDVASLHFLVSATWSGGKAVREYTATLGASPSRGRLSPPVTPGGELVVQWGDTLSHIVQRMPVPRDLHRFRIYLAVLRENLKAFIDSNMNLILSGAVLRLPTLDEIRSVSYSESVEAYSDQLARFIAYKESIRQRQLADADPAPAAEPPTTPAPDTEPPVDALADETQQADTVQPAIAEEPDPDHSPEDLSQEPGLTAPDEAAPAQIGQLPDVPATTPEDGATDESVTTAAEPGGARLTISQQVNQEEEPVQDGDQALLDTLETQLEQMEEGLLASDAESRSVQQNLQQIQEQAQSISTLLDAEDAQDGESGSPAGGRIVQQDQQQTQEQAQGIPSLIEVEDTSLAAAQDRAADAQDGETGQPEGDLTVQQDLQPTREQAEGMPKPVEVEDAPRAAAQEHATDTQDGESGSLAEGDAAAGPSPVETAQEPAVSGNAAGLLSGAVDSTGSIASGAAREGFVVEAVEGPLDRLASRQEPVETSETAPEPGTAVPVDDLTAQPDAPAAPAGDGIAAGPSPVEPAQELPSSGDANGLLPVPADSTGSMVGDAAREVPGTKASEDPVDQLASGEEPIEITRAEMEAWAAGETDDILLAQQDTPSSQGFDPQEPVGGVSSGPETSDAGQGASMVPAALDNGDPESAEPEQAVAQSDLLNSIKNVFTFLPDYGPKIAVGLLALLAGLFLWQRRKARKSSDAGHEDSDAGGSPMPSATPSQQAGDAVGNDSARDSAPERVADGGMPDVGEAGVAESSDDGGEETGSAAGDPMAEAEVYLAYERYEQAILTLKDGYAENPGRGELAEKLLEVYHMQDDRRAFDALVEELHRKGEPVQNVDWDRIVTMGREVSPENPLFVGGSEAEETTPDAGSPVSGPEGPSPGTPDSGDESDTALELARAYMELGEKEIARGYAEEVLNGGDEDQKEQARILLRTLST